MAFFSRNPGNIVLVLVALAALFGGLSFLVKNSERLPPEPQAVASASAPPLSAPTLPQFNDQAEFRPSAAPRPEHHSLEQASAGPKIGDADLIRQRGEILAKLPMAKVVLDGPKTMTAGDKKQVELRLGVNVADRELLRPNEPQNQQIPGQAHVSAAVEAELDGPGFSIEAKSPRRQSVADGFTTAWRWDIQALDPGERVLTATIFALISANGAETPQQVKSYSQPVDVRVKPMTFSDELSAIEQETGKFKSILASIAAIAAIVGGWLGFTKLRDKPGQNS